MRAPEKCIRKIAASTAQRALLSRNARSSPFVEPTDTMDVPLSQLSVVVVMSETAFISMTAFSIFKSDGEIFCVRWFCDASLALALIIYH
jgi:hypothetical protein